MQVLPQKLISASLVPLLSRRTRSATPSRSVIAQLSTIHSSQTRGEQRIGDAPTARTHPVFRWLLAVTVPASAPHGMPRNSCA
jgi:hypothetical protein